LDQLCVSKQSDNVNNSLFRALFLKWWMLQNSGYFEVSYGRK